MTRILYSFILIFLFTGQIYSQDVILPLQMNPLVNVNEEEHSKLDKTGLTKIIRVNTGLSKVILLDDFSFNRSKPNPDLWEDHQIYVNRHFALAPRSIGVATFDGLDDKGYPYEFSSPNSYGSCDTLTSLPIQLGKININDPNVPDDTVYLSFSFQPQGYYPFANSEKDSLILQFKNYKEKTVYDTVYLDSSTQKVVMPRKIEVSEWVQVWGKEGSGYYQNGNSQPEFRDKILMVDPSLYKDGFQFRFISFGNTSGSVDLWHIDNVYLSSEPKSRHQNIQDVAFRQETGSKLKDWKAMPWFHYYTNPDQFVNDSSLLLKLSNVYDTDESVDLAYYAYDENGQTVDSVVSSNTAGTIIPAKSLTFRRDLPLVQGHNFQFKIDNLPQYTTTYFLKESKLEKRTNPESDLIVANNSMVEFQVFGTYYAYDDGTAEAGYGVKSTNGGSVALKFELPEGIYDTLTACYIYFNPVIVDRKDQKFQLTVWNDLNGVPGNVISQNSTVSQPTYPKQGNNAFVKIPLDFPALVSGVFYIGYQKSTEEVLNVGYDLNSDARKNMFFNLGGLWLNAKTQGSVQNPGAIMIRPSFKLLPEPIVGVRPERNVQKAQLHLYPNPSSDWIKIEVNSQENWQVEIFRQDGKLQERLNMTETHQIDVSNYTTGLYLIRMIGRNSRQILNAKFIVRK